MKLLKIAVLFLPLLVGIRQLSAQEAIAGESAKEVIANQIKDSVQKINKLDVEGGLRHIHPTAYNEYTHVPQKPLVSIDRESLVGFCKSVFPSLGIKAGPPRNLRIVIKGKMAYATYQNKVQLGDSPPMMVRRTEIYLLDEGRWLLTHSHRSILQEG